MSTEEDLSEVNNEIQNLYDYCRAAGLSHEEIVKKAKPLLQPISRQILRRKCFHMAGAVLMFSLVFMALSTDHIQQSLWMKARHFLFRVQPWWDWSELYDKSCVVYNPYYQPIVQSSSNCAECEDLFQIDHLNKTSADEISSRYLRYDIPVIVSGAMNDWAVMDDSFTIMNLTEGYLDEEIYGYGVCWFKSNLRIYNLLELLEEILSKEGVDKWYAHWANCEKSSRKFLRRFYHRPYFISEVIEMTEANWVFMSSHYKGKKYKMVPVTPSTTLMWFAQLRGYHYVHLAPKLECEENCNVLEETVEEGDILLFNPEFWSFSYLPGEETENLAMAVSGFSQIT